MTKEQLIDKYELSATIISDLDAVIASEIAKAKGEEQPAPNPIREAYDAFKPIRAKCWGKDSWIKKYTEGHSICNKGGKFENLWDFKTKPEDWEIYTEAEAEKPEPNPIREAYEIGLRIREKKWAKHFWIKKQSETNAIDEIGQLWGNNWGFDRNPEKWELYTEPDAEQVTAPNPIREAYDAFKPIRKKDWLEDAWIKKHSEGQWVDENGKIYTNRHVILSMNEHPDSWEIYTEAEAEQVTDKEQFSDVHHKIVDGLGTILSSFGANSGIMSILMSWGDTQDSASTLEMLNDYIEKYVDKQPAKPKFDKDRFEAMFRAVVASGLNARYEDDLEYTKEALTKLDAYYASKEKGGNNE